MIRFLFSEGKSRGEIEESLWVVYGDCSSSMTTVKNWFNGFQLGRTSHFDEADFGRPPMEGEIYS